MAKIILGVSGSVACYRAADLARDLMRAGHEVRACLTRSAAEFVTPALFEALTTQPCLVDAFEEPERGRMAHIDWARWADAVAVAPATAHTINQLADGGAADMLTTICLATAAPLVIAPAMNPSMLAHEATQAGLERLRGRAAAIVEPGEGIVACGEQGQGRLASNADIAAAIELVLRRSSLLKGRRALITSGPTEEPIDSVRYLSNRSSGKMGSALARAAILMGAETIVVAGPQRAALPVQARVISVRTALEMQTAALAIEADIIIGAAAVADYRPAEAASGKIRRSEEALVLQLVPNPDIIASLAQARPRARVIAFAAEPDDSLEEAMSKARRKGVWGIAVNDISRGDIGFGSAENELTLLAQDRTPETSGRQSKLGCALWLLERAAEGLE
jgi:phosphopantothenoylcysteine decarboxylase/phosphopantothenate--cysteine ligase